MSADAFAPILLQLPSLTPSLAVEVRVSSRPIARTRSLMFLFCRLFHTVLPSTVSLFRLMAAYAQVSPLSSIPAHPVSFSDARYPHRPRTPRGPRHPKVHQHHRRPLRQPSPRHCCTGDRLTSRLHEHFPGPAQRAPRGFSARRQGRLGLRPVDSARRPRPKQALHPRRNCHSPEGDAHRRHP